MACQPTNGLELAHSYLDLRLLEAPTSFGTPIPPQPTTTSFPDRPGPPDLPARRPPILHPSPRRDSIKSCAVPHGHGPARGDLPCAPVPHVAQMQAAVLRHCRPLPSPKCRPSPRCAWVRPLGNTHLSALHAACHRGRRAGARVALHLDPWPVMRAMASLPAPSRSRPRARVSRPAGRAASDERLPGVSLREIALTSH